MADSIIITAEDIAVAKTYLPLSTKEGFARNIAPICLEPVDVRVGLNDDLALPERCRENRKLLQQYKMGLLAFYLNKPFTKQKAALDNGEELELEMCMDEDEYNLWASSHVFNQLERLKKGRDDMGTANRVFDLLYDFKMMENMLGLAIRDELDTRNDVFNRAAEFVVEMMTDEAMKDIITQNREELSKVADEAEKYAAERKENRNG